MSDRAPPLGTDRRSGKPIADQLLRAFLDEGYTVHVHVASAERASGPTAQESGVHVNVALLRQPALPPLRQGALNALTTAVLEPLGDGGRPAVRRQFAPAATTAFRLLPRDHHVVTDRVATYLPARGGT